MRVQVILILDVDTTNVDGMSDMDHAVHQTARAYLAEFEPTECSDGSFSWSKLTEEKE
jgi:hypothetical protein